jgi:mono/diheme cytochrome c family protein
MRLLFASLSVLVLALLSSGCGHTEAAYVRPEQVSDFTELFSQNCAGCHGTDGQHGGAPSLGNPLYQAWAPKERMEQAIVAGRRGTPMPAWALSEGGLLTDKQIEIIIDGMKSHFMGKDAPPANLPSYAADGEGDPKRGEAAFGVFCAQCHGADGSGSTKAGSVVDPAFLGLVTDQRLRMTVVVGCSGGSQPNFMDRVSGRRMQPQEITDVVAWVASHRRS